MDPVQKLREEFVETQRDAMHRASVRDARRSVSGALAGGFAGIVATATSSAFTRQTIEWHSFLLEGLFCTLAGYWLARSGGGLLRGVALFAAAYWLAFFARASGFDPGVMFAPTDLRLAAASHGHMMSLSMLICIGGVFGHVMES